MAADQHPSRLAAWLTKIDGNDRIDRFTASRVVFTYANPALAQAIDDAVSKPPLTLARRWFWCQQRRLRRTLRLPVKASISEVGEVDVTIDDCPRSATVLMDARARIIRARGHVGAMAAR